MHRISVFSDGSITASVVTPPPPTSLPGIYRILSDPEQPDKYWGGMSRTASPTWVGNPITPATLKLTGNTPVTIPDAAANLVYQLDNPHGTYTYVTRTAAGWSNKGQTFPKVEALAFEWNVVDVIRIDGIRAYIRLWNGEADDPCVIHRWWNIDNRGGQHGTTNPAGDGIGYIVLAYPGEYWIALDRLIKV